MANENKKTPPTTQDAAPDSRSSSDRGDKDTKPQISRRTALGLCLLAAASVIGLSTDQGRVANIQASGGNKAPAENPRKDLAAEALRSATHCMPGVLTLGAGVELKYFPDAEGVDGTDHVVADGHSVIVNAPIFMMDKQGQTWMGFTVRTEEEERARPAELPKPAENLRWINFTQLADSSKNGPRMLWEPQIEIGMDKNSFQLPVMPVVLDPDGYIQIGGHAPLRFGGNEVSYGDIASGTEYDHFMAGDRG